MSFYNDAEAFSRVELKRVGTYVYAEHPSTEILLLTYAINNAPVGIWSPAEGEPVPEGLLDTYLDSSIELVAHNAMFDRNVIPRALVRMGLLSERDSRRIINPDRWRCTMAKALTCALPASLDELGRVLGLPADQTKIADGKKLITRFCKPAPANHKADRYNHESHPELWARFRQYAINDIVAMRECDRRMPDWNYKGRDLEQWRLDQRINDRGFYVDRELVDASVRATATEKILLAKRFVELTRGTVLKPSQRDQFKAFIQAEFGLALEDTKAETLRALMKRPSLDPKLRELFEIAIAANKTSTSKYEALQPAIQDDDRFRGGLQFAGAGRTRRFAGRLYQPQNLPSRGLPKADLVDAYIDAVKVDAHEAIFGEDLMRLSSAALRGVILAPPKKKIFAADLSNIEGRKLAWFAEEDWKLQAFRDYDAGTGPDLYKVTAAVVIGGSPWDVPKEIRNSIGKVADLACFGAETQVLTNTGLKCIVDVRPSDKVWDGVEWVNHAGVVDRGVRQVVSVAGIEVTPDHLIRIGKTWTPALELVSNEETLSRALETGSANLPWSGQNTDLLAGSGVSSCSAVAELRHTSLLLQISEQDEAPGATPARSELPVRARSTTGATRTLSPMTSTGDGCSTVSRPASTGAGTRATKPIQITEVEASACGLLGRRIGGLFWRTWSHWKAGTNRTLSWIGKMSTSGTNRGISASSRDRRTGETNAPCEPSSSASQSSKRVYDVALAGPRTRFTILTDRGWLLVHNSGYQGGVAGYQQFARAYGVRLADFWDTIQKSVTPALLAKARQNFTKSWAKAQLEELEISDTEWLASEACKLAWRARHPKTVAFWYDLQAACVLAIRTPGSVHQVTKLKISCRTYADHKWLQILLPSGRRLCYFHPEVTSDGKGISYWGMASEEGSTVRAWVQCFTHGGKLTGNVCQTSARDLLLDTFPAIEAADFPIVLSVHDEVVTEGDEDRESDELSAILATNPPWARDLPLAAAGFSAQRYRKD